MARRLFTSRPARGATAQRTQTAVLWRGRTAGDRPVIVLFSAQPDATGWLASSLASALDTIVYVPLSLNNPAAELATAAALDGADGSLVGVIGEADAATAATNACSAGGAVAVRLALISPVLRDSVDAIDVHALPPTLLQFSQQSEHIGDIRLLDDRLRAGGVAVRATDYTGVGDEWALYPRVSRGSGRGLDDLLGFFRRGLGTESTFSVIPGWDLH